MPKTAIKTEKIEVYLSPNQKKLIAQKASFNKKTMSEYLLNCGLYFPQDSSEILKNEISFQQQQRSIHILIQFVMYIASFSKSKDEVLRFYESAYSEAIKEFGKEDN